MNDKKLKPLISIIVPVYNVELYIERCLDSILSQTYTNIEIVVIDDGSTDNSGVICDAYKKKDDRILVIHKTNGGLSDARNKGLNSCHGVYVTFIDSDDFIANDYIEYLYKLIVDNNADISICLSKETSDETYKFCETNDEIVIMDSKEAIKKLCYQKDYTSSAYAKLYNVKCFEDIRFPYGKLYEDIAIIYLVFSKANTIAFGKGIKYCYYQRENGIVRAKFTLSKMDYVENTYSLYRFVDNNYPEISTAAKARFLWSNLHVYMQITDKRKYKKEYLLIKSNLKKYGKEVIKDGDVKIVNKILIILAIFGNKPMRFLYSLKKNL